MTAVVSQNVDVFLSVAHSKKIQLKWQQNTPVMAHADPNMVDLVVRNLIDNAIKFTSGGGTISISLARENDFVWVAVQDTGTGIEPKRLAGLLGADHIPSQTGTGGEVGIGMGLSLCQEMVAVNGGELKITSEPAVGSEFRFSLPAC